MPRSLILPPWIILAPLDDGQVRCGKVVPQLLHKPEKLFGVLAPVVEKNPAYAARLAAMLDKKIFIALSFEGGIPRRVVPVAYALEPAVIVPDVFLE